MSNEPTGASVTRTDLVVGLLAVFVGLFIGLIAMDEKLTDVRLETQGIKSKVESIEWRQNLSGGCDAALQGIEDVVRRYRKAWLHLESFDEGTRIYQHEEYKEATYEYRMIRQELIRCLPDEALTSGAAQGERE